MCLMLIIHPLSISLNRFHILAVGKRITKTNYQGSLHEGDNLRWWHTNCVYILVLRCNAKKKKTLRRRQWINCTREEINEIFQKVHFIFFFRRLHRNYHYLAQSIVFHSSPVTGQGKIIAVFACFPFVEGWSVRDNSWGWRKGLDCKLVERWPHWFHSIGLSSSMADS